MLVAFYSVLVTIVTMVAMVALMAPDATWKALDRAVARPKTPPFILFWLSVFTLLGWGGTFSAPSKVLIPHVVIVTALTAKLALALLSWQNYQRMARGVDRFFRLDPWKLIVSCTAFLGLYVWIIVTLARG